VSEQDLVLGALSPSTWTEHAYSSKVQGMGRNDFQVSEL